MINRTLQKYKDDSDSLLVKKFIEGEEATIGELVRRHRTSVLYKIGEYIKDNDEKEDVLQDGIEKALNSLRAGKYTENGTFGAWLSTICRNLCIDILRRKKIRPTSSYDEHPLLVLYNQNRERSQEEFMIMTEEAGRLHKLIDELPDAQKDVVVLRYYYDMSFEEIAELKGININTALGRMHYASIKLAEKFKNTG